MTNGDDPTQVGGQPIPPDDDSVTVDRRRLILMAVAGIVLALVIGGGLAVALGGGDDGKNEHKAAGASSTSSSTSTSTSTSTTTSSTQPSGGGGGNGGGGGSSNQPTITSLSASQGNNPPCSPDLNDPSAPFDSPTDPIAFTVSWSTSNASQTVLSVDGPGAYGTYGPSGSANFTYDCSDASHTFKVTAYGPNGEQDGVAEKTITVTINAGP